MKQFKRILFLLSFILIGEQGFAQTEPLAFYLTWTSDPTTTMDVDWHLEELNPSTLYFRRKGTDKWHSFDSDVLPYPFSERYIHRVGIQGLKPDTEYELKFGTSESVYFFRTLPKNLNNKSIKIAIGGDSMHKKEWLEKTNRVVAAQDPDFVIIGGDMAYENGSADNIQRIYDWFDAYTNTLVTAEKRIIPCIVAVGNHEVVGGFYTKHEGYVQNIEFRARIAPYFYNLFSFPGQPGYNVLDFGKYLSLIILDSEHTNPVPGAQTEWLVKTMEERKKVTHKIPIYHVPAYPSVRDYDGTVQTLVRETWTPIFDANEVALVFENHDHAYKRTFPIKNMEINESGIIYVGDGSYGVTPRNTHSLDSTWYLNKAQSIRAFTLLTLENNSWRFVSIDENGNIIDTYPEKSTAKKEED